MEDKRQWEEIATTHTYVFDRQDKEIEALKLLTLDDFKEHFNSLFFSPNTTKRLDFELTSVKHAEKQSEWTTKNAENQLGQTHISPAMRKDVNVSVQTFKKGQALHADVYKANFASN